MLATLLPYIIPAVGIILSLYLWGIIRTALWTLPTLFINGLLSFAPVALLSFWSVCALTFPYKQGGFDSRTLSREKQILIFFLSGVLTGSFFYPAELLVFALGSGIPLLCLILFRIFRFPVSRILFVPKVLKFLIPLLWGVLFLLNRLKEMN